MFIVYKKNCKPRDLPRSGTDERAQQTAKQTKIEGGKNMGIKLTLILYSFLPLKEYFVDRRVDAALWYSDGS